MDYDYVHEQVTFSRSIFFWWSLFLYGVQPKAFKCHWCLHVIFNLHVQGCVVSMPPFTLKPKPVLQHTCIIVVKKQVPCYTFFKYEEVTYPPSLWYASPHSASNILKFLDLPAIYTSNMYTNNILTIYTMFLNIGFEKSIPHICDHLYFYQIL